MNNYIENCKVLGLGKIVGARQLKDAYREKIKQCHPDKYISDIKQYELAIEKTKQVNIAYTYLTDFLKKKLIPRACDLETTTRVEINQRRNYSPGLPDESVLEIPLKSSHTVSVGYDYEDYILFIKFANSKVYKFFGISPKIFEEFITAKSHHQYAHHNIFFKFPYVACNTKS